MTLSRRRFLLLGSAAALAPALPPVPAGPALEPVIVGTDLASGPSATTVVWLVRELVAGAPRWTLISAIGDQS